MARGRPTKRVLLKFEQPLMLNKSGVTIIVWDKYRKKRRGRVVVSVGGLRWFSFKKQRRTWRYTWDELSEGRAGSGRSRRRSRVGER